MRVASSRDMPTAAKLVGAVVFGGVGAAAAWLGIPTLPEEVPPGYLLPLSAGLGVWLGWTLMGRNAGRAGRTVAINYGIATVIVMVVAAIFSIAFWEMIERSMRLRYDGPGEAVLDVANLIVFYGKFLFVTPVLMVLALGAVLGGVIVHAVSRLWR